jgi:hypothetical protein
MAYEIILKVVLTIIGFAVTGLLGYLVAKIKEYKKQIKNERKEQELIKNGVKMLLQSNLTNVFYVHNELGQIEDYKLKNWYNELHEYEELGGNDYMHVLKAKMAKLKIIRTDVLGEQHYEQK